MSDFLPGMSPEGKNEFYTLKSVPPESINSLGAFYKSMWRSFIKKKPWTNRRQEELKKLAENNDDDYMNSAWADSSALKRSLTGMGSIRFGPR